MCNRLIVLILSLCSIGTAAEKPKLLFMPPVPIAGATEWTQLLNNFELIASNARLASQLATAISQLDDMRKHGIRIQSWQWAQFAQQLTQLSTVARQGSALAYSTSQLEMVFKQRFPGYHVVGPQYYGQFQGWSRVALDTLAGAAGVMSSRNAQLNIDQAHVTALQTLAMSSPGRMGSLDTTNQIGIYNVQQLQALQATILAAETANQSYMGAQLQKQAVDAANAELFFGYAPSRAGKFYNCCN